MTVPALARGQALHQLDRALRERVLVVLSDHGIDVPDRHCPLVTDLVDLTTSVADEAVHRYRFPD